MSTLRKQTRSGYTHISNEIINEDGMSYRAKGIAMVLLSKPDNWTIKIDYLMKHGKEGEKAIRTALHELAEYGYLMRARIREDDRVRTVTYIADYPAYIETGTVEQRINGYAISDIPFSDRSETSSSQNRQVRNGELLVTPELITTEEVKVNRKSKKKGAPKSEERRNYRPDEYSDIILG